MTAYSRKGIVEIRRTGRTVKLRLGTLVVEEEPSHVVVTLLTVFVTENPAYSDWNALYVPTGKGVTSVALIICKGKHGSQLSAGSSLLSVWLAV